MRLGTLSSFRLKRAVSGLRGEGEGGKGKGEKLGFIFLPPSALFGCPLARLGACLFSILSQLIFLFYRVVCPPPPLFFQTCHFECKFRDLFLVFFYFNLLPLHLPSLLYALRNKKEEGEKIGPAPESFVWVELKMNLKRRGTWRASG